MKPDRRQYEARARIAKALAHPSRLILLEALQERELCVCELTQLLGVDQSTVSKHLAILRGVGLIDLRREGQMSYYRLTCKCLNGFFTCIESVLRQHLKAQQEALAS